MASHDFQVILRHSSLLPANDFVNTLHFDVNAPDTVEGCCDGIAGAYATLAPILPTTIVKLTIKAYPPGPNPGGPEFQKDYVFSGNASPGPGEVALCLSYSATDEFEASTPRRRGRIYVGPIAAGSLSGERPAQSLMDLVLDFGEDLAAIGFGGNTTWQMLSRRDNSYHKIEAISVDNAWDTQRRRGLAASARTQRDVQ